MAVYKDKWNGYKGDTWRVAVYYKIGKAFAENMKNEDLLPRKKHWLTNVNILQRPVRIPIWDLIPLLISI